MARSSFETDARPDAGVAGASRCGCGEMILHTDLGIMDAEWVRGGTFSLTRGKKRKRVVQWIATEHGPNPYVMRYVRHTCR